MHMWLAQTHLPTPGSGSQGTSLKEAHELIAETQADTIGSRMPLMINASKGFAEQRLALSGIVSQLGLKFQRRMLRIPLGNGHVECAFNMRDPLGLARYAYRFITREHCRVRRLVDPVSGGRIYADPYSCDYAESELVRA